MVPIGAAVVFLAIVGAIFLAHRHKSVNLGETDWVLVSDFVNATGDPVFDQTLRQGLTVQLQQSPFLALASDESIQRALRFMSQPPDTRLTPKVALEVCQRTASAVVLAASTCLITWVVTSPEVPKVIGGAFMNRSPQAVR